MELNQFIATVKLYYKKLFSNDAMYIIQVLYSRKNTTDEQIIEKALIKSQLFGDDLTDFKTTVDRNEIVRINTDLIPTQNGRIPDPIGSVLRNLRNYILENRETLIGNNYIEFFYDSSIKKIVIKKMSSPNLVSTFFKNLPEDYKKLFDN